MGKTARRNMANWAGRENLQLAIALFAEFIGTMLFQYFGGSPMAHSTNAGVINGLLLMVIVWMTAEWSGGHVNPAVTLGLLISGNIKPLNAVLYWVAQFTGGILGAVLTSATTKRSFNYCETMPDTLDNASTFCFEFWATFILVWTVHMTAVEKPGAGNTAPFAIGLAIAVTCGIDGMYTGGYANPARFLSPLIVNHCNYANPWIYLLAEFSGGAAAATILRFLFMLRDPHAGHEDPNESPRGTTKSGKGGTGQHQDISPRSDRVMSNNSKSPRSVPAMQNDAL